MMSNPHRQPLFLCCCISFLTVSYAYSQNKKSTLPEVHHPNQENYCKIRVLTYNIQHGKITSGEIDLDLYAQVIKEQAPDIVALQEIDNRVRRSGKIDETAKLAKRTGLKGYFGKFRNYGGGDYGDAILSKYSMLDFRIISANSSLDKSHSRTYIFAKLKNTDDVAIYFNCSHLTPYVEKQKTIQAREIAQYYESTFAKQPLIVAGDLNSVPTSDAMHVLFKQFNPSDPYFSPTHNARTSL